GQAIIAAILKGERDPYKLADLKHDRVQASREEVARSLEGNWRPDVLFELQQAVDSYQFAHRQMQECDTKLQAYLAMLPTRVIQVADQPDLQPAAVERQAKKPKKPKKPRGNAPALDLAGELKRISGGDPTSIDGIHGMTAHENITALATAQT